MANPAISSTLIGDHVAARLKSLSANGSQPAAIDHENVFETILEHIEPIDFHAQAGQLDPDQPLTQMHYIVLIVREVLRIAILNCCGLCRNLDFFYKYNGAFWQLSDRAELETFLGEAAEKLGVDSIKAEHYKFRMELSKQFHAKAHLPERKIVGRRGKILMNVLNGTCEVTTAGIKCREFRRDDFLTYQMPFRYDPDATAPRFQQFLDDVLPDKSKQLVLAEFIGYIFSDLKLEKALILFGGGANGKSVFCDIISAVLGDSNISSYSIEQLGSEYSRAAIANKLLNYASEISGKMQTDIFKRLTSGEKIAARLPYGQPMEITNYARFAFNANELPHDVEITEAFFRRFLIIHFDKTVPAEKRNPRLAEEIISSELAGVFNWIVAGLQRLTKQNGFTNCPSVQNMVDAYRRESDSVAMFVAEEGFQASERNRVPVKEIYGLYKNYCTENINRPLGRNKFCRRLEALGIPRIDSYQPLFAIEKGRQTVP